MDLPLMVQTFTSGRVAGGVRCWSFILITGAITLIPFRPFLPPKHSSRHTFFDVTHQPYLHTHSFVRSVLTVVAHSGHARSPFYSHSPQ